MLKFALINDIRLNAIHHAYGCVLHCTLAGFGTAADLTSLQRVKSGSVVLLVHYRLGGP